MSNAMAGAKADSANRPEITDSTQTIIALTEVAPLTINVTMSNAMAGASADGVVPQITDTAEVTEGSCATSTQIAATAVIPTALEEYAKLLIMDSSVSMTRAATMVNTRHVSTMNVQDKTGSETTFALTEFAPRTINVTMSNVVAGASAVGVVPQITDTAEVTEGSRATSTQIAATVVIPTASEEYAKLLIMGSIVPMTRTATMVNTRHVSTLRVQDKTGTTITITITITVG
jgi:uncharacterized Fe-S center protein